MYQSSTSSFIITALTIFSMLLLVDIILIEPHSLQVTDNSFDVFGGGEEILIVYISDLHAVYSSPEYFSQVVGKIQLYNPDLILIGGDITDSQDVDIQTIPSLYPIRGKYGTYAVLGNHDYYDWECNNPQSVAYANKVETALEKENITVMRNENEILRINGHQFALIGVDDYSACQDDYDKALTGVPSTMSRIILVHEQEALKNRSSSFNPDTKTLILASHTHCGQFRLPFIGSIPKFFGFEGDVDMGRVKLDDSTEIYVTCGVTPGTFRLLTRPEISVIRIS